MQYHIKAHVGDGGMSPNYVYWGGREAYRMGSDYDQFIGSLNGKNM